ncbi:G-protein-signaling modulator 2 isoform X1 [Leptopilina heterotoma]|uniref:G-protein-signaling modulator 2 isoform X1 n=1 Tax=Leptopilina heterotoma TaxID=63436 RepID=UPI001CA96BAA|nr:G-protein-signaling modulator 2 isoform X1 [Leptopilina heterotoma]
MSLSASAENLSSDAQNGGGNDSNMCLELALEGERLCKAGDCKSGVAFFQAAIQAGTDDLRTLSAIYSQLGNAYFYLGDYVKAMNYHKLDLTLARSMGDKLGEAKSSGNLGNTLKVMGKFDEAMICCKRHLAISKEMGDKMSEGRALYNLGNVYHAKGKQGRIGYQNPGEFSEEVRQCLQQAVFYYEENLKLMREFCDSAAQGRACGNLGNTFYLLGDFQQAIFYHNERLKIAREFGDKAAERRANSNLGNCHIFLGEFEKAAQHYKRTLVLAKELGDRAVEAQACDSLGNTYTLLRDYPTAVEYHLRHLEIAQQLKDRVGEGRACWSLGNAYSAMGNHEKALHFANQHLNLSKELGDEMGQATAQMNVEDLQKILGIDKIIPKDEKGKTQSIKAAVTNIAASSPGRYRLRRESMDNLHLIKLTPEGKKREISECPPPARAGIAPQPSQEEDENNFFELLSRFQSGRMDDQRCALRTNIKPNIKVTAKENKKDEDDLLELIAGMQSKRMDEQRVVLPFLPGLNANSANQSKMHSPQDNDDSFIEMLVRCQQDSRIDDQRSILPMSANLQDPEDAENQRTNENVQAGATVPEEDLFALIQRLQAGRMEDQRASGPGKT